MNSVGQHVCIHHPRARERVGEEATQPTTLVESSRVFISRHFMSVSFLNYGGELRELIPRPSAVARVSPSKFIPFTWRR